MVTVTLRPLNERRFSDGGNFLSSMVGDSQISLIVLETHFSSNTVGRELWLGILSSLLCPETDRNIRIEKQDYVFILSDFKK